ncbi:glycine betaine ABC transporter substrate-binding protein [Williamsia sp. MIQD14]|uniref:glycine betaine ABC transporter substrate-binding protein n=1 Tax=Williamsia sp. MIQD14 TaxID=3425703 RepID=UPI003DA007D5
MIVLRAPAVPSRRRARITSVMVSLLAVSAVVVGCSTSVSVSDRTLVVGSGPGTAPAIAADIYAEVLRHEGATVRSSLVTGSYRQLLDGLDRGTVDLFGAFGGSLLSALAPGSTATSTDAVYDDLNRALPQGVSVGDPTTVVDQLQVVVAARTASTAGVDELSECSRLPAGLPVVSDRTPDEGTLAALATVGCRFGPFRRVADVAAVTAEVTSGRAVGLVSTLSTAGNDAALTVLADKKQVSADARAAPTAAGTPDAADQPAIRAQNLVPVFATAALDRDLIKAVNKVAGELTTADLATMAEKVSTGTATASSVVSDWLSEHNL